MDIIIKDRIEKIKQGAVPVGYVKRENTGLLPVNWQTFRLSDICNKRNIKNTEGNVETVLSNTASEGVVFQRDCFEKDIANEENSDTYYIVEPGDFVYNPRVSRNAPFGPINANKLGIKGIVSPLYTVFNQYNHSVVDDEYLAYYFSSSQWHDHLYRVSNQGARYDRMNVSDKDFFEMPISLPNIAEQKNIVDIFSQCDKVINLKKQLLEEKHRQKKWLTHNLLNPDSGTRLAGYETSKWIRITLKDLCSTILDGDWIESADQSGDGIRLFQTGNIGVGEYLEKSSRAKYIDCVTFDRLSCSEVFEGDVLLSRLPDPIGRACILPSFEGRAITAVDCSIMRFKEKVDASFFVQYACQQSYFNQIASLSGGSTRIRISRKELEKLTLSIPESGKERYAIVEILVLADRELQLISNELHEWINNKNALMQLLLSGIIRVHADESEEQHARSYDF